MLTLDSCNQPRAATLSELWTNIQRSWNRMGPPLRPNQEVVDAIKECLADRRERLLILGVTPEFADLGDDIQAVDSSKDMIGAIWPGDTTNRRATEGLWTDLPCENSSRQSSVCDGGLTLVPFAEGYSTIFNELSRVLEPEGRAIFRVFCPPSPCESLETLEASIWNGEIQTIHAMKFRLAMALVAQRGVVNIPLRDVWDEFTARFPDRDKLAAATGWSNQAIDTIDFYRESDTNYSYPTADEIADLARKTFENVSLVSSGTYEMADRSPLLVLDKA